MTRCSWRRATVVFAALVLFGAPAGAQQYFGRNKVQYENFDWRILKSDHFDSFFYPAESIKVHDAARQSERWYSRLSDLFRHQFDRKSLVFYADHPDFQQTNVISDQLSEGTGGVTEGVRTRVILPFTGVYADDEHVIGHELVHVFQYNVAETAPGSGGLSRLGVLPLWLVEGMAEYFSLGRNDALTAMWMRDAVMRDRFPTIRQLTTDSRFFPYRYGQALWAYIAGRWGDRAVVDVYRTALRYGWDQSLVRALGLSADSLSKDWAAANKAFYAGQIVGRSHPDSVGRVIINMKERSEYNVGPAQSADGRYVAFFTSKTNLFGIDLVMADATTGKVIRTLAGPESDGHFDAISFLNSSGAWSPDGQRFAFIVYNNGDNEITVLRTRDGDIEQRYRPADVGAIYNLAWSPDGRQIVFAGSKGGVSDLYLLDVQTRAVRQLTNDKYADLQPTFSPDGRTIAFSTDRSGQTSFEEMTFGELQLATLDVATGQVTTHRAFSRGKHINAQYSPDGRNLFFISDQDGISDIYRMELASSAIFRVTRVATGVSGVTKISPAMSIAHGTGRLMFTVFKDQGYEIVSLEPSELAGQLVDPVAAAQVASGATLPPGDVAGNATVAAYLGDPRTGLVSGGEFRTVRYRPSFALDALGQPSVGVQTGTYGTGLVGGISALWGDQLGDQMIYSAIDANGTVRDFGGAVFYQNLKRRLNWGAGASHTAYLTGGQYYSSVGNDACGLGAAPPGIIAYNEVLQRIFIDQALVSTAYPLSQTRRFELSLSGTRQSWEQEARCAYADGNTGLTGPPTDRVRTPGPPALAYGQGSLAFVGDNSYFGFTSPLQGGRYRFEASPIVGSVKFTTGLADMRRYLFKRPFTLAFRGMYYGRHGGDAENYDLISPIFLGDETLIRGYSWSSFQDGSDCVVASAQGTCPAFDRLLGSRIGVVNAELRVPLLGPGGFGLIKFPLPLEVAPFFDAGMAWTSDQAPSLRFTRSGTDDSSCTGGTVTLQGFRTPCAERIPVFSYGASFRVNLLGYAVLDTYLAHPFQRPTKDWVLGFQLAPGW